MTAAIQTRFDVTGMDCAACAAKIDAALRRLPGIDDVSVSVAAGTMKVSHAEDPALVSAVPVNPASPRRKGGSGGDGGGPGGGAETSPRAAPHPRPARSKH